MIISTFQIKKLREKTGAGIMDCKNALVTSNGNIETAIQWLREKGIVKAQKTSNRITKDGLIGILVRENKAVIIEVNCETDFVSRSKEFQDIVRNISVVAINCNGSLTEIYSSIYPFTQNTVLEKIQDYIRVVGENIVLRRAKIMKIESGIIDYYIHNSPSKGLGKIGVLVAIETDGKKEPARNFCHQIALHIASANPIALNSSCIHPEIIEREKNISYIQAYNSGKSESVIKKIVENRLQKFFNEVTLLSQKFVIDPNYSVEEALKNAEKYIGKMRIVSYLRFSLGEDF